jgi:hypothetical protein
MSAFQKAPVASSGPLRAQFSTSWLGLLCRFLEVPEPGESPLRQPVRESLPPLAALKKALTGDC